MKNIWDWIKNNPNRTMFLIPIILVAGISISHVVTWYDIANPISWAVYLSIAIEVAAMTALVAVMNKIKGGVWFMFGLVTFIQMIGNIFFSFNEVDSEGALFKSWIELTSPLWEAIGSDINDVASMKRWLAFLEGGLLPIISLTSLHFFIKYDDKPLTLNKETKNKDEILKTEVENSFSPFLNEDSVIDSKNNNESSIEDSKKNNESSTENTTSNSESSTEKVIETTKTTEEIVDEPIVKEDIEKTSTPEKVVETTSTSEEVVETTSTPEEVVDVPIVEDVNKTTEVKIKRLSYKRTS